MRDHKEYYDTGGAGLETKPMDFTTVGQKIRSRLTGQMHEIELCPLPAAPDPSKGGEIPKRKP